MDRRIYYCVPYSPWPPGSNENMNCINMLFLPKGMVLPGVTSQEQVYNEVALNDRPRKVLDFKTSREVYKELEVKRLAELGSQTRQCLALHARHRQAAKVIPK